MRKCKLTCINCGRGRLKKDSALCYTCRILKEKQGIKKYYKCKWCGYSPNNRADWCDLGCGSDYNEMIVCSPLQEPREKIDNDFTLHAYFINEDGFEECRVCGLLRSTIEPLSPQPEKTYTFKQGLQIVKKIQKKLEKTASPTTKLVTISSKLVVEKKESKIREICKQLYQIGFNDGKNEILYSPRPYGEYADKIIALFQLKGLRGDFNE